MLLQAQQESLSLGNLVRYAGEKRNAGAALDITGALSLYASDMGVPVCCQRRKKRNMMTDMAGSIATGLNYNLCAGD